MRRPPAERGNRHKHANCPKMATAPKSEQPEMVLGRSAAAFMERAAEDAEASAPTDHFLARLQRAEARDAASPTGGGHRSAAVVLALAVTLIFRPDHFGCELWCEV